MPRVDWFVVNDSRSHAYTHVETSSRLESLAFPQSSLPLPPPPRSLHLYWAILPQRGACTLFHRRAHPGAPTNTRAHLRGTKWKHIFLLLLEDICAILQNLAVAESTLRHDVLIKSLFGDLSFNLCFSGVCPLYPNALSELKCRLRHIEPPLRGIISCGGWTQSLDQWLAFRRDMHILKQQRKIKTGRWVGEKKTFGENSD